MGIKSGKMKSTQYIHTRNSLTMGVDKPNIRTVVHIAAPPSVESYLQESGRASRDGKGAEAWLLSTPQDPRYQKESPPVQKSHQEGQFMMSVRQHAMRDYATNTTRCRREMLLEYLGTEPEDCPGCDICSKEQWLEAPETPRILQCVSNHSGRLNKGQLARLLSGRESLEARRSGLFLSKGFGTLKGWEIDDLEEAIESLLHQGKLKQNRTRKLLLSSKSNRLSMFSKTKKPPAGVNLDSGKPSTPPAHATSDQRPNPQREWRHDQSDRRQNQSRLPRFQGL